MSILISKDNCNSYYLMKLSENLFNDWDNSIDDEYNKIEGKS